MKYCDLHCDALTCKDVACVNRDNLLRGGCLLQCFAAFIDVRQNRYERALALADKFNVLCKSEGFHKVLSVKDIKNDKINALLTIEDGGAIEGDLGKLDELYARGVRMIGLTWNYPNELGYPCFPDYEGIKRGRIGRSLREKMYGLTDFGRQTVARMNELGIVIDVSHGSDKLLSDVLFYSKKPVVASHSNAQSEFDCARNLTDGQIKRIALSGGVVGLNFCTDFLSLDRSAEGQREAILRHAKSIVKMGGEDCLALGSDFDGITPNAYVANPTALADLFEQFSKIFGSSVAEKIANKNFLRVFRAVCG